MSEKLFHVASQKGLSFQCVVLVGIEVEVCDWIPVVNIHQCLNGGVTNRSSASNSYVAKDYLRQKSLAAAHCEHVNVGLEAGRVDLPIPDIHKHFSLLL